VGDEEIRARGLVLARLPVDPWATIGDFLPRHPHEAAGTRIAGVLAGLDLQDDGVLFRDGERAVAELVENG
jgi:hypothetical protein